MVLRKFPFTLIDNSTELLLKVTEISKEEIQEAINLDDLDWELVQREYYDRELANEFLHVSGCRRNHKETKRGRALIVRVRAHVSVRHHQGGGLADQGVRGTQAQGK